MAEPNLRRGQGPKDWVLHAQKLLNYALSGGMHIDVPENGVFDEDFEQEVKGFQGRKGIEQDGKIGPDTWAALKAAVEAKQNASSADEDPDFDAPREAQTKTRPDLHRDDNVFRERKDKDGNPVRVYDMEGEDMVHSGPADWNEVVGAMVRLAQRRNTDQVPYVTKAVERFGKSSDEKITQFAHAAQALHEAAHIEFPWALLIDGLDSALGTVFTVSGVGGWIYGHLKSALIGNIVDDLTSRTSPVPGLEAKLRAGVAELAEQMANRQQQAIDTVQRDIHDHIRTQMLERTAAGEFTNDSNWIDEMVAYFGFPERSSDDVIQPILSWLNHQFDAMLQQAHEELLKTV